MAEKVYIENDGALFRGYTLGWPDEVYRKGQGFVPYACEKVKPQGWGEVIDEAAAKELMQ